MNAHAISKHSATSEEPLAGRTLSDVSSSNNKKVSFYENDVRKAYQLLKHEHETEVRLIDPKETLPPKSVFVHTEDEFVKTCREHNGKYNIYAGINERKRGGTKAEDVLNTKTLFIDIDPRRKDKKGASTAKELDKARNTAKKILEHLKEEGIKVSGILMSGNGYQIWLTFPEIKITDENRKEMNAKLQALQKQFQGFSNAHAEIDNVGDLPRIAKIAGTISIKGSNTDERPHRLSRWEYYERKESPQLRKKVLELRTEKLAAPTQKEDIQPTKGFDKGKLAEVLKKNTKLKDIYEGKGGEWGLRKPGGERDRSREEFNLILGLQREGFKDQEVLEIMNTANTEKWQETGNAYKTHQIQKARAYAKEKLPEDQTDQTQEFVPPKKYNAEQLRKLELPKDVWLVKDLIPKKGVVVMAGRSGQCKTWSALEITLAVATGEKAFGEYETNQTKTLYIDDENGIFIIAKRLRMFSKEKQPKADGFNLVSHSEFKIDDKNSQEWLEKEIKDGVGLVVLDSFAGCHNIEENKAAETRKVISSTIGKLAHDHEVAFLLIHHLRKASAKSGKWPIDYLEDMRGSSELRNIADVVLGVGKRDPDTPNFQLARVKCRFDMPTKPRLMSMTTDEEGIIAFEDLGEEEEHVMVHRKALKEIVLWLQTQEERSFKRKELLDRFESSNMKRWMIDEALKLGVAEGALDKPSAGYYSLKGLATEQQKLGGEEE